MKFIATLLISLLVSTSTFTAKVIRIVDGDTIVVLNDNKEQIRVRLEGIDCPESKQPFSNRATCKWRSEFSQEGIEFATKNQFKRYREFGKKRNIQKNPSNNSSYQYVLYFQTLELLTR
jgi:endonuclease YncB( thermonuclease family)